MPELSFSEPVNVSVEQGHSLSLYCAAIILFNTFNDSHKDDQPWIRTNMQKLLPLCEQKIRLFDSKIKFKLKSIKKDIHWNIYLNICYSQQLQQELNNLLHLNDIIGDSVDFKTNLVQQVIETHRKFCIQCSSPLTRRFQHNKLRKGTIGIKYTKKGPILTVNYVHQCSNDHCDAVYYHNRYIINNGIHFESNNLCHQMNSKATHFDDDIINECFSFNLEGLGTAIYVEKWNQRFKKQIEAIKLHLTLTEQKIGYRKSVDASLHENRLLEAVSFRRLHCRIEEDLKRTISIEDSLILNYQQTKKTKTTFNANQSTKKYLDDSWIDCNDLFNLVFDKYAKELDNVEMDWMKFVPVKNGHILHKHFLMGGDGNVKITVARCAYPLMYYQKEHEHLKSNSNQHYFNQLQCNDSPQKGNKSSKSFSTCSKHTNKLIQLGCPPKKINELCKYEKLKQVLSSTKKSKSTMDKAKQKLETMKNDDVKLFNDISDEVLQKRPKRKNHSKTRANLRESQQWIDDEKILHDFESICNENNVNPAVMANPDR